MLFIWAIQTDIEYVRRHTLLLMDARKWEENAHLDDFVLRGEELAVAKSWLVRSEGKVPLPDTLHREYIEASRKSEAMRKAEAERIARMVRNRTRAAYLLLVAVIGALAATGVFVRQASEAREQVFSANATLTPISVAALTANAKVIKAQDEAVQAQQTITVVSGTVNAAQVQVTEARAEAISVAQTLTPISLAVVTANAQATAAQVQLAEVASTLTPLIESVTKVAGDVLEGQARVESLRLAALATEILQHISSRLSYIQIATVNEPT